MRERAVRIGGKLTVMSSSSSGTEIKLVVHGGIIFQRTRPVRKRLLAKMSALVRRLSQTRTSKLDCVHLHLTEHSLQPSDLQKNLGRNLYFPRCLKLGPLSTVVVMALLVRSHFERD